MGNSIICCKRKLFADNLLQNLSDNADWRTIKIEELSELANEGKLRIPCLILDEEYWIALQTELQSIEIQTTVILLARNSKLSPQKSPNNSMFLLPVNRGINTLFNYLIERDIIKRTENKIGFSIDNLSKRELEILVLIVNGNTNQRIADQLFISQHTVKTHRKKIKKKMQAKTTSDLIRISLDNGLEFG